MEKCMYSICGKCTNDNVSCDICNSTKNEMENCIPFQQCIVIHGDDWSVNVKINSSKLKELANDRIRNLIEEIVSERKMVLGNSNCPYYDCKYNNSNKEISCEECKEQFFDNVRDELLKENLLQ